MLAAGGVAAPAGGPQRSGRSLLQPIRILSGAMAKVAAGDLGVRIPVTSNDEVGELTGQFNRMVEGLREREQIRETFGRYVDESVAATILRRQGEGGLASRPENARQVVRSP